jgi:single-stranded-DNA-specific exonuclease
MVELLNNIDSGNLWVLKNKVDNQAVADLMSEINVSEPIAQILLSRGILNFESAKIFFSPSWDSFPNPFLMADMQKAVERISQAILNNEKIMVYGDYDVDGTTSVALMTRFLKLKTENLITYIPDRYTEGYGVSFKGIDVANENGVKLIIALDCGITAHKQVDYAKERGIDFIICDHHLPEATLPNAFAILDPKRKDCKYPFKELSGCGVGFKLCQALCRVLEIEEKELFSFIDLLAVSIAADIVPMINENRVLTFFGLKKLNDNPLPGIKALLGVSVKEGTKANVNDLVFRIGPRINAAGRMATAQKALDILLAETEEEADKLVGGLNQFNSDRRDTDQAVTAHALEKIEKEANWYKNSVSTVVMDSDWHKGVVGIVASRLIERIYKPTLVFTGSGDILTGSARSIEDFDVHYAIGKCKDLIIQFGGHAHAAGLTIKKEHFLAFRKKFNEEVKKLITPGLLTRKLWVDAPIKLSQINENFFNVLLRMSPFGPGNLKPRFFAENVYVHPETKIIGKEQNHLRLVVADEFDNKISGPWFNQADLYHKLTPGQKVSLVFTLEENWFNNKRSIQMNPLDIFIH